MPCNAYISSDQTQRAAVGEKLLDAFGCLEDRSAEVVRCRQPQGSVKVAQRGPGVVVRDVAEIQKAGEQDYWTTTFDMLEALDVTLRTLPPANYLTVSANARDPASGFAVGLCTTGNPKHLNDRWRSLSSAVAAQLQSRLPGTVIDVSPEKTGARDFADSAAIMAGLDLVVSVDTSVAHLAGALDKPCLLLLPGFGTDWRWLRGREDSPWYPRHTLFRSEVDGDWSAAIEAVAARAAELAAES